MAKAAADRCFGVLDLVVPVVCSTRLPLYLLRGFRGLLLTSRTEAMNLFKVFVSGSRAGGLGLYDSVAA